MYLDEQKMYSLSSQIFEGITEYIIDENINGSEDKKEQKGPVGSGRILADVINTVNTSTQKKFLHDHSYSIFEDKLAEDNRILEISDQGLDEVKESIKNYSFVKIQAKSVFHDMNKLDYLFNNFNEFGNAFIHMTNRDILEKEFPLSTNKISNSQKQSIDKRIKELSIASGMYLSPKFLESIALLTKFGFSDQFEIHQNMKDVVFTSCLKREYLREKEELLVKKYSRKTEKEIIVLGIVTQAFDSTAITTDEENLPSSMREGIQNLIEHVANIENSMSGKREHEVVLDPIAVYTKL